MIRELCNFLDSPVIAPTTKIPSVSIKNKTIGMKMERIIAQIESSESIRLKKRYKQTEKQTK